MELASSDGELGDESGDYTPQDSCSCVSEIYHSTEQKFGKIRDDVMAQQNAIEGFIAMHENREQMSESFVILQHLFSLFKATTDQNMALQEEARSAKAEQLKLQKKLEKVTKRIQYFMANMTHLAREEITSLDDVFSLVKKQVKQVGLLNQKIEKLQHENVMMSAQMRMMQQKTEEESAEDTLEMAQLRSRVENAEKEASELSEQLSALKESNSSLEQSVVLAEETENQHRSEIQQKNEELERTVSELERFKSEHLKECESAQKQVTALQTKLEEANSELKTLKVTVDALQEEKQTLSAIVSEGEKKIKAQTDDYRRQIKTLKREVAKKKATATEVDQLNQEIITVKKEHEQALADLQNRSAESENEIGELLGQKETLRRENHKLRKTLRASSREQQRLESENSQLAVAVQRLKRELHLIKKGLETSEEYETTPKMLRYDNTSLHRELTLLRKNLASE